MYNAVLFNEWANHTSTADGYGQALFSTPKYDVHKSKRHHDGKLCFGGGYFIVVAQLPSGQISNHYKLKYWDLFDIPAYQKAKYEYDGHTSKDVLNRLNDLIK